MTSTRQPSASLYTQVEVSPSTLISPRDEQSELLRHVIREQERTNDLLEELVGVMATREKQRANELNQWRNAHPQLSAACRQAAEALSRVQIEYLDRITDEINDSSEDMVEGDFVLNEFIDRYGPRLAHLNGVIQVLAQLSSVANPANAQS
jgi:hypothetical protein